MKKLPTVGGVALAALIAVMAMLGFSTPAQAYPELRIELDASAQVLYGGEHFTATAKSSVDCAWTLEWNGVVRNGQSTASSNFDTVYTAPQTTRITKIPLHGTCRYDGAQHQSARASAAAPATFTRTIVITVLPPSTAVSPPGGSNLPSTGGPNLLFLLGGLALLVSGATAVSVARRRAEEAEFQASGA